jgi:hypothetical protein
MSLALFVRIIIWWNSWRTKKKNSLYVGALVRRYVVSSHIKTFYDPNTFRRKFLGPLVNMGSNFTTIKK